MKKYYSTAHSSTRPTQGQQTPSNSTHQSHWQKIKFYRVKNKFSIGRWIDLVIII